MCLLKRGSKGKFSMVFRRKNVFIELSHEIHRKTRGRQKIRQNLQTSTPEVRGHKNECVHLEEGQQGYFYKGLLSYGGFGAFTAEIDILIYLASGHNALRHYIELY